MSLGVSTTPRTVLVTGASGQDGSYLVDRLLARGDDVHAFVRPGPSTEALLARHPSIRCHEGDLRDADSIARAIRSSQPDQVYNLAGTTSVAESWDHPVRTADVLGVGTVRVLDAVWRLQSSGGPQVRVLHASSAEVFGDPEVVPQNETTPHNPVTPYGAAKAYSHRMVQVYRERGLFGVNAVLYNHESPRRPETFVARKISRTVARIALGLADELVLGNTSVTRDWGFAGDVVDAMLLMLDADTPTDYVVATGEAHSVHDFVVAAFAAAGIDDWRTYVRIDRALYRPADPKALVGDSSRLRALGWRPSVGFQELVTAMVHADLHELRGTVR